MVSKRESSQQRLKEEHVNLSYKVQIGGAIENKVLPFVLGVIGDFASQENVDPDKKKKLNGREFENVDLETFDVVMRAMGPQAKYRVKNVLDNRTGEFGVNLKFNALDDFRPEAVVQQFEPLKELLALRTALSNLRGKLTTNEKLEDGLLEVLKNIELRQQLAQEAGIAKE
jgi:type VI secretion system protein ImpB